MWQGIRAGTWRENIPTMREKKCTKIAKKYMRQQHKRPVLVMNLLFSEHTRAKCIFLLPPGKVLAVRLSLISACPQFRKAEGRTFINDAV